MFGLAVQAVRTTDAKGRHTTTRRSLHQLPGCAIIQALAEGQLSANRWAHYQRLLAEQQTQAKLSEAVHQRRARHKAFGKMAKTVQRHKRLQRDG